VLASDLSVGGHMMRVFLATFLLSFSALVFADEAFDTSQCLHTDSNGETIIPESRVTPAHLTVTDYIYFGDIAFKLTSTPVRNNLSSLDEGCDETDQSVLVYRISNDQPSFYSAGEVGSHEVNFGEHFKNHTYAPYKAIGTFVEDSQLVLTHKYLGNCGGCFKAYLFGTEAEFRLKKSLYFDPAKYGEEHGPILKLSDADGNWLSNHSVAMDD